MATLEPHRVCVFSGSSPGRDPAYTRAAAELGEALVARGIGVVYGGASVGLMGTVADAALAAGGEVIGVIPRDLEAREIAHPGLRDLRVVGSMHERKALMADLAGGFVALPGGFGTLEEVFEVITWGQLGIHAKPVGLLDVAGYWTRLRAFLDHAVEERFVRAEHRDMVVVEATPAAMLDAFDRWTAPTRTKWIDRVQR
jgi:uncharacterized protein (TIGR00730 family)